MNRLDRFIKLKEHAFLKKSFSKLKDDEVNLCINFITETSSLDKNEYAKKAIRLFLDKEKPKHWKLIEELLIASI